MPTYTADLRRGARVLFALLAASVLASTPAFAGEGAADTTPDSTAVAPAAPAPAPAKPATPVAPAGSHEKSGKGRKAHPPAAAPKAAPKPRTAKAARPPKPPGKSLAEQRKEDGVWTRGNNWLGLRAGYAKSTALNSGDGLVGYGMAYQHMLNGKWGFGGAVQHDLLGHLGTSTEISVPFTLEMDRHFKWNTSLRPYLGFGGGYYFHKYYRTGTRDTGAPGSGVFIAFGANLPLSEHHVLGFDVRTSFVSGRVGEVNPVFGPETASQTMWSAKLTWAMVY